MKHAGLMLTTTKHDKEEEMIQDIFEIILLFVFYVLAIFVAELLVEWAEAYKKRGYISKRKLRKVRELLEKEGAR